jgi:hypothetical protein
MGTGVSIKNRGMTPPFAFLLLLFQLTCRPSTAKAADHLSSAVAGQVRTPVQ